MNSSYFIIERSTTGNHFEPIDTIAAFNNGPTATTYLATDNFPSYGINYYRLKIVDAAGHVTYSALVMVRVSDSRPPLVYPILLKHL